LHHCNINSVYCLYQPVRAGLMAKRPLSVQLRPLSAFDPTTAADPSSHDGTTGSSWSARRLSMGDITLDQNRLPKTSDSAAAADSHTAAVGRRPVELSIAASAVTAAVLRRRDRCSPSSCKRPIVTTLPRLDLSLIQGRPMMLCERISYVSLTFN